MWSCPAVRDVARGVELLRGRLAVSLPMVELSPTGKPRLGAVHYNQSKDYLTINQGINYLTINNSQNITILEIYRK